MNDWLIIFIVTMIAITMAGREAERDTTVSVGEYWSERTDFTISDVSYREGMAIQDTLWGEIQAIKLLEDKYFILPKKEYEKRSIIPLQLQYPSFEMLQYSKDGYFKK